MAEALPSDSQRSKMMALVAMYGVPSARRRAFSSLLSPLGFAFLWPGPAHDGAKASDGVGELRRVDFTSEAAAFGDVLNRSSSLASAVHAGFSFPKAKLLPPLKAACLSMGRMASLRSANVQSGRQNIGSRPIPAQ
jgi:hypothetical protein